MTMVARARQEVETTPSHSLPTWPATVLLIGYPVWWITGLVDFSWIIFGAIQMLYLLRLGTGRGPRGFGVWLAFLVWMTLSVTQLDTFGRLIGFTYRWALYLAATALFLYIFTPAPSSPTVSSWEP
ncbi:hypothetical protein [Serinicoccus sp. CNJ-927]|uniref:hypothetical protein n=1 Tax=Serinicoccus sp. CNJ-927 TaxID=1904970 RepID=UPI0013012C6B|nr:hypothetical protein [Serinicoccus sp. CNJ-927]